MGGIGLDEVILDATTSNIAISDGTDTLEVNADGSLNAIVTATDLDIRDLSATQDNVAISDGTDTLEVNADGSINVNLTDDGVADGSPDTGNPLKVGGRAVSGVLTAVDTGDRVDNLTDLYRRQWVNDSANIAILNSQDDVSTTAAEVLASPLAGRRFVTIQNEGNSDVYLGSSAGVTAANGIKLTKNNSATYEWGEDINIFMISASGTQDVRFLESA